MAAPSTGSYFKVDSIDSQTAALATPPSQHERYFANASDRISPEAEAALSADESDSESDETAGGNASNGGNNYQTTGASAKSNAFRREMRKMHEMQRQPLHYRPSSGTAAAALAPPTRSSSMQSASYSRNINEPRVMKHKKFTTQRSILKNSIERGGSNLEEQEILEAKKQLILRRRRLFSHYRQYEQWRRRQFSYDPTYFRANPLPIGQAACGDYYSNFSSGSGAFRRRRQFRKQYSCAERSREDSRESRDSSTMHKCHSMVASDTINSSDTSMLQQQQRQLQHPQHRIFAGHQYERISHFHMLQEERSTSISERCTRSRINSAIFVSSEGRGFDSIEFLRRHGSQSVLCRKARSAENITDNARKKSFSEQRQWRTDEEPNNRGSNDNNAGEFELKEIRPSNIETRKLSVLNANIEHLTTTTPASITTTALTTTTAAVTTAANVIVGSISIEAPPSNLFDDSSSIKSVKAQMAPQKHHTSIGSTTSASHDSTDTVEELIPITATSSTTTAAIVAAPVVGSFERKSRVLVRQRSSTTSSSPIGTRSQSPATNPKPLFLKGIKPKVISNLPMVSVSGPSPQDEKPECL